MWRILRIFFLFFFASVIRNIEQLRIIISDTRGSCSREENKTIIWKSVQKIQTFKRWQQFASKTDTIERKQNRRAIALLRKSRLFPGKRVINNNRTLDLTLSLSFHFLLSLNRIRLSFCFGPPRHPLPRIPRRFRVVALARRK